MKQNRKYIIFVSIITFLCLLLSGNALAQRGRFRGFVADEQGNPIAGAFVIAENPKSMSGRIEIKTDKRSSVLRHLRMPKYRIREFGILRFPLTATIIS